MPTERGGNMTDAHVRITNERYLPEDIEKRANTIIQINLEKGKNLVFKADDGYVDFINLAYRPPKEILPKLLNLNKKADLEKARKLLIEALQMGWKY
jgi:hypothetical protein